MLPGCSVAESGWLALLVSRMNASNMSNGLYLNLYPPYSCPFSSNPSFNTSSPHLSYSALFSLSCNTSYASLTSQKWKLLVCLSSLHNSGWYFKLSFI